jgi:hypothetical protein
MRCGADGCGWPLRGRAQQRLCAGGAPRDAGTRPCTLIGHAGAVNVATALQRHYAHGEDYDDTFEGGPVHAGA